MQHDKPCSLKGKFGDMTKDNTWPESFDVRSDTAFQQKIKPFIDEQLAALKAYDEKRIARQQQDPENIPEVTYKFYDHALRVADDVARTCTALGLPDNVGENMRAAMLLHDIGKHTVPIDIWDSKEKPTGDVKKARREHTVYGLALLHERFDGMQHPFLALAEDIMKHHHEHLDGTGHHGLKAEHLSLPVRLASIVESYDGYTIPRAHFGDRDISPAAVIDKMRSEDGKGAAIYDMELFEAFARMKLGKNQTPPPSPGNRNPASAGK
ncbi:MAG: HD domain-containing protein [Micavibrio aeruginosavorus]|nr:HD domain-containing protein [Micavibrio aeruginosavorus]